MKFEDSILAEMEVFIQTDKDTNKRKVIEAWLS